MPDFTLADLLGAQFGAPGPVYEGGPVGNVTPADVLGPSWLERAQRQAQADAAAYQRGGVPELLQQPGQTAELAGGFGGNIRAYHGSPYDFAKFDLSKIGTGAGAQTYGHGLYFAENPAVAQSYKKPAPSFDQITVGGEPYKNTDPVHLAAWFKHASPDTAIAELEGGLHPATQQAAALLKSGANLPEVRGGGRMYEVNINAKPEQFLQWDAPLQQQSQAIQEFASRYPKASGNTFAYGEVQSPRGEELYKRITANNPSGITSGIPQDMRTSMAMNEAGIPGIKYLDQGSRGTSMQGLIVRPSEGGGFQIQSTLDGKVLGTAASEAEARQLQQFLLNPPKTSNYVVFNPDIVDIRKKWALLLAAMGGAGAPTMGGVLQAQLPPPQ